MPSYTDQDITCKDCHTTFCFTAKDQAFYAEQQFSPPARCKSCRTARKAQREANGGGGANGEYAQRSKEVASDSSYNQPRRNKGDDRSVEYRRR